MIRRGQGGEGASTVSSTSSSSSSSSSNASAKNHFAPTHKSAESGLWLQLIQWAEPGILLRRVDEIGRAIYSLVPDQADHFLTCY